MPAPTMRSPLLTARSSRPLVMPAAVVHSSIASSVHAGHGNGADALAFADQVDEHPAGVAELDVVDRESGELVWRRAAELKMLCIIV